MSAPAPVRRLRTGFYFLQDGAGHRTNRPLASSGLLKEANGILAAIGIEMRGMSYGYVKIDDDLGTKIDFSSKERVQSGATRANHYYQLLYDIRKRNSEPFSVFFAWDFVSPDPTSLDSAFTWRKDRETICVMRDDVPKAGRLLAHEAGHALGIDYNVEDAEQLMHEYDLPGTGILISRDQAARMRASKLLE